MWLLIYLRDLDSRVEGKKILGWEVIKEKWELSIWKIGQIKLEVI